MHGRDALPADLGRCTLHVACCMLHVACMLHVVRCMLHIALCMLHVARCMLHAACCTLHVARCMVSVGRCMLSFVCCMLSSACCLLLVARWPQALVERGVSRQLQWLTKAALLVLFHAASTPDHRLALCALLGVPFLTELVVALPSGEPATADAPAEADVALFGIAALNVSGPSRHVLLMLVGRLMTESKNCKLFVKEELPDKLAPLLPKASVVEYTKVLANDVMRRFRTDVMRRFGMCAPHDAARAGGRRTGGEENGRRGCGHIVVVGAAAAARAAGAPLRCSVSCCSMFPRVVLQHVTTCRVAACCNVSCCSMLQRVVLQHVATCRVAACCHMSCCSMLQRVVLQHVATCRSMLRRGATRWRQLRTGWSRIASSTSTTCRRCAHCGVQYRWCCMPLAARSATRAARCGGQRDGADCAGDGRGRVRRRLHAAGAVSASRAGGSRRREPQRGVPCDVAVRRGGATWRCDVAPGCTGRMGM